MLLDRNLAELGLEPGSLEFLYFVSPNEKIHLCFLWKVAVFILRKRFMYDVSSISFIPDVLMCHPKLSEVYLEGASIKIQHVFSDLNIPRLVTFFPFSS